MVHVDNLQSRPTPMQSRPKPMRKVFAGLAILLAAVVVAQFFFAELAKSFGDTGGSSMVGQVIFGFHAVNGLAILAAAGTTARRALAMARPGARPVADGVRSEAGQEQ